LVSRTGDPGDQVPQRLLTVREVAKALNVSTSTVYKLCEEGKLPHVRVSNAIRVHPAALAGWSGEQK
jgi:excisionase family DNA binding protein